MTERHTSCQTPREIRVWRNVVWYSYIQIVWKVAGREGVNKTKVDFLLRTDVKIHVWWRASLRYDIHFQADEEDPAGGWRCAEEGDVTYPANTTKVEIADDLCQRGYLYHDDAPACILPTSGTSFYPGWRCCRCNVRLQSRNRFDAIPTGPKDDEEFSLHDEWHWNIVGPRNMATVAL